MKTSQIRSALAVESRRIPVRYVAAIALLFLWNSAAAAQLRSAEQLASDIGLSHGDIERVIAGEVISTSRQSTIEKELNLVAVLRLNAPLGAVSNFVDAGRLAEIQTVSLSRGPLDPNAPSMAEMTLPDASLERLIESPSETFSLSRAEAERIEEAARSGKAAALDAYRSILENRVSAYWRGGLEAIEAYAGENRSPANDLSHANAELSRRARLPNLTKMLTSPPKKNTYASQQSISWSVLEARDVAAPVLIHRMFYAAPDGEIVVERHFYSGYDYDDLQIVVAILPTNED